MIPSSRSALLVVVAIGIGCQVASPPAPSASEREQPSRPQGLVLPTAADDDAGAGPAGDDAAAADGGAVVSEDAGSGTEIDARSPTVGDAGPVVPTTDFRVPRGDTSLLAGPDGALWFTVPMGDRIGRMTLDGVVTEFPVPGAAPGGLTVGPDGNLWFVEYRANLIGTITPGGVITEHAYGIASPSAIATGTDGNLWVTGSDGVTKIAPDGQPTLYPANTSGAALTTGDGQVWFGLGRAGPTADSSSIPIERLSLDGASSVLSIPCMCEAKVMLVAPDHRLWITGNGFEAGAWTVTPDGAIHALPVPGEPDGMALAADGSVWIGAYSGNFSYPRGSLTRLTGDGSMQRYSVARIPESVAVGPDGAIWFTSDSVEGVETASGWISRFAPPASPARPTLARSPEIVR